MYECNTSNSCHNTPQCSDADTLASSVFPAVSLESHPLQQQHNINDNYHQQTPSICLHNENTGQINHLEFIVKNVTALCRLLIQTKTEQQQINQLKLD